MSWKDSAGSITAIALVLAGLGGGLQTCSAVPGSGQSVTTAAGQLPANEHVRQILQRRIEEEKRGIGIAVGLLDTNGFRVVAYGSSGNPARPEVDGRTLFEIGSITKTFTAALLADMVHRGEVTLNTTIRECLPAALRLPSPGPGDITLRQLATHSSGLPRMPDLRLPPEERKTLIAKIRELRHILRQELGSDPPDKPVPWVHTTRQQLLAWLADYRLKPADPHPPEYSNVGMELLGEALGQRAGRSYESLIAERIFKPLGMTNSCIRVPAEWEGFFAIGHTDRLQAAPRLNIPDCPGAGAISSTVEDMLKYLAANLNCTPPIDPMLHRVMIRSETMTVGLNWIIGRAENKELIWHNGGTQGFSSFAGFNSKKRTGVVVLSNTGDSVDDIGLHLLAPQGFELLPASPRKPPIPLGPAERWLPLVCLGIGLYFLMAPIETPGKPARRQWIFGKPLGSRLELTEIVLAGVFLEPVINFAHYLGVKKCLYIVYTFRHYARDETDAKELSE